MSKYSLKKEVRTITIDDDAFEIREMTAAVRDAYLDRLGKRLKKNPNGDTGVSKFEGLQADLISSCLHRGEDKVKTDEVQTWPASVVVGIFKECQDVNQLAQEVKEAEDELKNG